MTLVLQVSDPHFGTEQPPVVEALVRLAREQAPTLVVVSGDITQRARRRQFRAARAFVDRLGAPATLAIPGNHDISLFNPIARLFSPYTNYCREFGAALEPVFESDHLLVIALNTTRIYRHIDGEVSAGQVARVAKRLEGATSFQLRIVVTHQPVAVTRPQEEANLLHGRATAIRSWARAGADLILGGHIHLPYVLALHEQFAGLRREVWVVQAGTAVSWRVRHDVGNSVNLLRYAGVQRSRRCVAVERWDYSEPRQAFLLVTATELSFPVSEDAG